MNPRTVRRYHVANLRVGILCEFSGVVRDAFRARGHDAVSCDTRPTLSPGPHIQGDCLSRDWSGFDLLICHPPCKLLSRAGLWMIRHHPHRERMRDEAAAFAVRLWELPVARMALENPIGHLWKILGRPTQTVNPYDFGEPARKATRLWIRGLPVLAKESNLFQQVKSIPVPPPPPIFIDKNGKPRHFTDAASGQSDKRSVTFTSIAAAMADQWGGLAV